MEKRKVIAKLPNEFLNSGYSEAGASYARRALRGFNPISASPNEDINWNNQKLRERSRILYMSTPIAASAIKTNRTNVVGQGLLLNSQINKDILGITPDDAIAWQRKTETEFALWASDKKNCDAIGVNDFYSLQQLALTSWLMSGDTFCLFKYHQPTALNPYELRLHIIEADRVSTPGSARTYGTCSITDGIAENGNKIYDGVEIDSNGMIVAYHICNNYKRSSSYVYQSVSTDWKRVEAYGKKTGTPNILHIMEAERPEQYRGVPYLAPVIEPLLQLRRYSDSEITKAVIQSFYTAFILTEDAEDNPFNEATGIGSENAKTKDEYELGPGSVNFLNPGESVQFADPTSPTSNFDVFVKAVVRQIGSALEIPNELMLKEFSKSYSASRGALLEAWKAFRMRREWLISDFCQPVYAKWLDEAVAKGRIQAPGYFNNPLIRKAWQGAVWEGPAPGMLDPVKEIQAEEMAIKNGFSTHQQSTTKLNGGNWTQNVEQLSEENKKINQVNDNDNGGN